MVASIRQYAAATSSSTGSSVQNVTLGSAPVQNNLLLAVYYCYQEIGVGNGYTILSSLWNSGNLRYTVIAYKYAGASESASQNANGSSSTPLWGTVIWEIEGVSGTIATDIPTYGIPANSGAGSQSSLSETLTPGTSGNIVLGATFEFVSYANPTMVFTGSSPAGTTETSATGPTETFGVSVPAYARSYGTGNSSVTQKCADGSSNSADFGNALFELGNSATASTETGNVSLALGGVSFAAHGSDDHGGATLALTKVSFLADEAGAAVTSATIALSRVSFAAQESLEETGNVALAIGKLAIQVYTFDTSALSQGFTLTPFGS